MNKYDTLWTLVTWDTDCLMYSANGEDSRQRRRWWRRFKKALCFSGRNFHGNPRSGSALIAWRRQRVVDALPPMPKGAKVVMFGMTDVQYGAARVFGSLNGEDIYEDGVSNRKEKANGGMENNRPRG